MGQMKIAERRSTIIDTSVLINYLSVGRIDLLIKLSHRHMLITEEVHTEIIRNRTVLEIALSAGQIEIANPLLYEDIELFARLTKILSIADASCIVAARALGTDLAADDRILRREALKVLPEASLFRTEALLAEAVRTNLLLIEEGNSILQALIKMRYRPSISRLQELLGED